MNRLGYLYFFIVIAVSGVINNLIPVPSAGQSIDTEASEVYLDFRYRGAISTVVVAQYKNNEFFLPVNELMDLLELDRHTERLTVSGMFGTERIPYKIDFPANTLSFGKETYTITNDDFLLSDLDSYLSAVLFGEIFGLHFMVDFNNLSLQLETDVEIPAVEKMLRRIKRARAQDNRYVRKHYDLKYGRNRTLFDGGFIDYNLTGRFSTNQNVYSYSSSLGLQVAGGDLEGTVFGNYSENFSNLHTNGLRWRYVFHNQPAISQVSIGQTRSDGVISNPFTGIRISNEPLEPRYEYDEFEIQGNTIPESEVELYLNNMLIDFQQADALGRYRFLAPVAYGTSQFDLKIYGPTGQIIERSDRIQIPFNFQPTGVFNYALNAGQSDVPMIGSTKKSTLLHGNGSYGINEWMTLKAGAEYYEGQNNEMPFFTGALSTRLFSNYIVTLEGVSNAYYRGTLNVIYGNAASFNLDYTSFTDNVNIYNNTGDNKRIIGSLFYPFSIADIPFNIRISSFSRIRTSGNSTSYRADVSSNLGKLNLRAGYSDQSTGSFNPFAATSAGNVEASATYNISSNPNLPGFLRGFYIRTGLRYMVKQQEIQTADFSVSRNILKRGRLQASYGRNFVGKYNSLRFSLVVDFNKIRTGSTFNSTRNMYTFTQNVRGSAGFDSNYNNLLFTSRNQVGRAGAAVRLFTDNDNSGTFNPETDEIIIAPALRADRTGTSSMIKNGVLYLSQMQPYYYYNMEINPGAVKNPMLVPDFDKFGMITDPNQYKKIEIPFYMSGVIEGKVERGGETLARGIGGLKLILQNKNTDFSQEIRTFSDGSFYAFEIPPGNYSLFVDEQQLAILGVISNPDTLHVEVKAIPDGDFIEGLGFKLLPPTDSDSDSGSGGEAKTDSGSDALRLIIKAQNEFYNQNFEAAMRYIGESLAVSETSQAYALKGSLHYLSDEPEKAELNWKKAKEINPDTAIPDINMLDELIKKGFQNKK